MILSSEISYENKWKKCLNIEFCAEISFRKVFYNIKYNKFKIK